jgi:hypothetical protein
MEWIQQATLLLIATGFSTIAILYAFRRGWIGWGEWLQVEEVARLNQKIREQEDKLKAQDIKLGDQEERIRKLIEELLGERRKTDQLETRIAELEKEKGQRIGTKVLGIWSRRPQDVPLDLEANRDAIYDAGFSFVALFDGEATRQNIFRYLRREEVSIVELGGHGTPEGIMLADGLARPGWWEQILRDRKHIRIVLLLVCFSDQSMFEAVKRAGVPHIITVTGEISDRAAIQFAQAFYANYANGLTVVAAVREAKLILDYTEAAKIELPKTQ